MTNIVPQDLSQLVKDWMKAESKGERYPVPLHDAWNIAGHSKKQDALNLAKALLEEETDYLRSTVNNGKRGRPKEALYLSCDALKHWAIASQTKEGRMIRQYFIEAEKSWKLVQQTRPEVAGEIEEMKLRIELAKIEAQKEAAIASGKKADLDLIHFRHYVTTALPEAIQQKVLGYEVIKQTEVIEKVIDKATGQESDGVGITYLANRLGFKTTAQCWKWLEYHGYGKDSEHWELGIAAVTSRQLPLEHVEHLEALLKEPGGRQLFLGE